jgi:D-alanyl-lipoteichoic acid acyltransferase DltB (MBOAT superfamily)
VIFHSLDFAVFFIVTTAVYWSLPHKAQNAFIILASYVFYGYVHPWFLALILATTVADYWAARGMARWPARRRVMLGLSLAVNLGLLGFFKYFGFFTENVRAAVHALSGIDLPLSGLSIVLPVGISFYTFQELSYTIEVYRGRLEARRSFLDFAAFVCFYPQLVAGPIERASHLLPQIEQPRTFSWPMARAALALIAWGYFKKLVVADNAGLIANKVFASTAPGFSVLWAGVFAFAVQIYADFSAYSDIARGVARWLGVDLMRNFNHPYMATGPIDFWRRWHISLSTWFRDYVYIPMGGSRAGAVAVARNLMATFVLSGLWHGASWNYALWGAYHGALVVVAHAMGRPKPKRWHAWLVPVRVAGTFALVLVGWLFFRETDTHMLLRDLALAPWDSTYGDRQIGLYLFLLALMYSTPLWIESLWTVYVRPRVAPGWLAPSNRPMRVALEAALAGLAFALILVLRSRQSLDFIYFQF